jgi:cytochrome d ubiquinol oxidase subunit I
MKTADGASTVVSANDILGSLIMFLLVYLLLFIMFIMLFLKFVKNGPPS